MRTVHISWLLSPAGGGIPPAMFALAREQASIGADVRVMGVEDPAAFPISLADYCSVYGARGPLALGYAPAMRAALLGSSADVTHLHGLFTWPSRVARQWGKATGKPVVVSPHGMLEPWALANSAWKKRVFSWLVETDNLRGAACLHSLSIVEASNIRRLGYQNPIAVIPNGVDLAPTERPPGPDEFELDFPAAAGRRLLLFLGRIHPKKGLPHLLRAWAALRDEGRLDGEGWLLVVAGPDQLGHSSEVEALAASLGLRRHVRVTGPLHGNAKRRVLAAATGFVLPSFSEGFSMAVLEALAWKLPVIVTRQCNFDAESIGAGWVCEPNAESVAGRLRALLDTREDRRKEMGLAGRREIEKRYTWPNVAREMLGVYGWLIGGGTRPACVEVIS